MATVTLRSVLQHLRKVVLAGKGGELTDAQLLDCYVAGREDAAFETIVRRHGRMVLGVCRRVLGNVHDAEDAFQATFLVLARKAASVRPRERLGNWLHGVAVRTALKARTAAQRRQAREARMSRPEAVPPDPPNDWRAVLDEELERLPDKYRAALVLCDLEGKTHKEAARQLGWAEGTLSTRLTRARQMLVGRLSKRGVTISGVSLATALAEHAAATVVPCALVTSTLHVHRLIALASAGVIPPTIAVLMEGAIKSMGMIKAKKLLALAVIAIGTIGLGVGGYQQLPAEEPAVAQAPAADISTPAGRVSREPLRAPSGPPLWPALVHLDKAGEKLVIKRQVTLWQAIPVTRPGLGTSYEYRPIKDVQTQTLDLRTWQKPARLFDGRGRELPLRKLAGSEVLALVADGPADPATLGLLRKDTLVLQLPQAGPPIAAPPPAPTAAPVLAIPAPPPAPAPAVGPPAASLPVPPPARPVERVIFRATSAADYTAIFDKVKEIVAEYFEIAHADRFEGRIETSVRLDDSGERLTKRRAVVTIVPLDDATDARCYSVRVEVLKSTSKDGRDRVLEQIILRRLADFANRMAPAAPTPPVAPPLPAAHLPTRGLSRIGPKLKILAQTVSEPPGSGDRVRAFTGNVEAFIGPGSEPTRTQDEFYIRCQLLKVSFTGKKPAALVLEASGDVLLRTRDYVGWSSSLTLKGQRLLLEGTAEAPARLFQTREPEQPRLIKGSKILYHLDTKQIQVDGIQTPQVAPPATKPRPSEAGGSSPPPASPPFTQPALLVPPPPPAGAPPVGMPQANGSTANPSQWTVPGTLRKGTMRTDDDREIFFLVNRQGQTIVHATCEPGLSLKAYVDRKVSLYGRVTYSAGPRTHTITVTHVVAY